MSEKKKTGCFKKILIVFGVLFVISMIMAFFSDTERIYEIEMFDQNRAVRQ